MKKLIFLLLLLVGNLFSEEIEIEATLNDSMSSTNFAYIDFIIKNKNEEWKTLKDIKIKFQNEVANNNISFLYGIYFNTYLESIERRNKIREANNQLIQSALLLVGGGLFMNGDNNTQEMGKALIAGGTLMGANDFYHNYKKLYESGSLPKNYILSNILVPPYLEVAKFVILQSKNNNEIGFVDKLKIEYTIDNQKFNKELTFQKPQYETEPAVMGGKSKTVKRKLSWQDNLK